MPPNITLADALEKAKRLSENDVLRTAELPRNVREFLLARNWLHEIMKGYAVLSKPDARANETTLWQANYWNFLAVYLKDRFGHNYVLNAENSLDLLTGNNILPRQVIVYTTTGGQGATKLPHGFSVFSSRITTERWPDEITQENGLFAIPLEAALVRVSPTFFEKSQESANVALHVADISKLARAIVSEDRQKMRAASRISNGLCSVGRVDDANTFSRLLQVSGFPQLAEYETEHDSKNPLAASVRIKSPYIARIREMWKSMRATILNEFPPPSRKNEGTEQVVAQIEDVYVHDAYHSLSIEGYRVSEELIAKIARGDWDSDSATDKEQFAAMAAKGYYDAFQCVLSDVRSCLDGGNPVKIADRQMHTWFASLFSPSVHAGLLNNSDLFGFRNHPVYIRDSQHTPPPSYALPDAMGSLFECLDEEAEPSVRALFGHYAFTYIHPYPDGNGRIGRFLMNMMLVSGGYPWTIIQSDRENRHSYLDALECASVARDFTPFVKFVRSQMEFDWSSKATGESRAPTITHYTTLLSGDKLPQAASNPENFGGQSTPKPNS